MSRRWIPGTGVSTGACGTGVLGVSDHRSLGFELCADLDDQVVGLGLADGDADALAGEHTGRQALLRERGRGLPGPLASGSQK